jgi:site-specific DNA-methyltransferase (adenine-specific)
MNPDIGRFPANLIHDGSDDVVSLFPETKAGVAVRVNRADKYNNSSYSIAGPLPNMGYADSGSAARFFYCAKASRAERNAGLELPMTNIHATVKPVALMEYLAKLTKTPTGGVVLDPFMGSGTTGIGCVKTGRPFIGIELDEDYFEIAKRRILHAMKQMRLEI